MVGATSVLIHVPVPALHPQVRPLAQQAPLHPPLIRGVNREVAPYLRNLRKLILCRTTFGRICGKRTPADQSVADMRWTGHSHFYVVLFHCYQPVRATLAQVHICV